MVEEKPLTVRCPRKPLFITRSLNKLKEKGLSEELQKSKAQSPFSGLLILTTLPDILSLTAEKHSQELEGAPKDADEATAAPPTPSLAKAPPRPGSSPYQRGAEAPRDSLPAAPRSAGGRRARLPAPALGSPRPARGSAVPRGGSGGGSPRALSCCFFLLRYFSSSPPAFAEAGRFLAAPSRGEMRLPRGGRLCVWGCVPTLYTYICIIYMGVPV